MAKRKYMYKGSSRQPIKKCSKGRVLGIFEKSKFNENSNFESDSKFQQCYDTKNAILANLAFLSVDMDNLLVGEFSLQVRNFSHNFFLWSLFLISEVTDYCCRAFTILQCVFIFIPSEIWFKRSRRIL